MHHKAQLLVAVGVINGDQLIANRHRSRVPLSTHGQCGLRSFRPAPVCHRGTPHPPQPAFLQALVGNTSPWLSATPTPITGNGRGLEVGHGPAAGIAGSVSSSGVAKGSGAVRLAGVQSVAPDPSRPGWCPGAAADQQGLAQDQGVLAGWRAWMGRQARQHPFDVAIQDRQPKIEGTGKDAACSGAADARQRHPHLQAARPR